jgi:hypothetical protein
MSTPDLRRLRPARSAAAPNPAAVRTSRFSTPAKIGDADQRDHRRRAGGAVVAREPPRWSPLFFRTPEVVAERYESAAGR